MSCSTGLSQQVLMLVIIAAGQINSHGSKFPRIVPDRYLSLDQWVESKLSSAGPSANPSVGYISDFA